MLWHLLFAVTAAAAARAGAPPPPPGTGVVRAELVCGGLSNASTATLAALTTAVGAAAADASPAYGSASVLLVPISFAAFGELQLAGVALPLVPNTASCLTQAVASASGLPVASLSFLAASQGGGGAEVPLYAYAATLAALPAVAGKLATLSANGTGEAALLAGARACGLDAQLAQLFGPPTLSLWLDASFVLPPASGNGSAANGTAAAAALQTASYGVPLQAAGLAPSVALALVGVPLYYPPRPAGGGLDGGSQPLFNPDHAVIKRARVGLPLIVLAVIALVLASRLEGRVLAAQQGARRQTGATKTTQLPERGRAPSP